MKPKDLIQETYTALSSNKARSGLTILGIVIGIGSVIAMVSIGQGAQSSIQSSIEGLGSNLLTIFPGTVQPGRGIISSGRGAAQTLKTDDMDAIRTIQGVSLVAGEIDRRFQVSAPTGNNTNVTIIGTIPEYAQIRSLNIAEGSFITDSNQSSLGRVAVLGSQVVSDLFGEDDPLGQSIRIGNSMFKVIGTLQSKGGSGFANLDDMVFVPLSTAQKVLTGIDFLSTIAVSVQSKDQMTDVSQQITDLLSVKHRVATPDFSIISQADILGTLNQVTSAFTAFLAAIASISLVVGGIGIMNMMLTTVTERTREIGLRKAIGATQQDIHRQFLIEATTLTFLGGTIGIFLGWLISYIVTSLGLIQTKVSLSSVILAFGVSAAIGIIFGYYPARRASKMNPIEALRYE